MPTAPAFYALEYVYPRLNSATSKMIDEQDVTSASQLMHMFTAGNHQRKVGGTKMNAESSRSHSVFSILLEVNAGLVYHVEAFGVMVSSRRRKPTADEETNGENSHVDGFVEKSAFFEGARRFMPLGRCFVSMWLSGLEKSRIGKPATV